MGRSDAVATQARWPGARQSNRDSAAEGARKHGVDDRSAMPGWDTNHVGRRENYDIAIAPLRRIILNYCPMSPPGLYYIYFPCGRADEK